VHECSSPQENQGKNTTPFCPLSHTKQKQLMGTLNQAVAKEHLTKRKLTGKYLKEGCRGAWLIITDINFKDIIPKVGN